VTRGLVDGLATPHPMGPTLPALYQEDALSQRLTEAFDAVLAPVLATLDNLGAYLDPAVTPEDILEWLGGWVGIALDETWEVDRRRAVIARAVELYHTRGTVPGLAAQVEILTGGVAEIVENGAAGWSVSPGTPFPGTAAPSLLVRVKVARRASIDAAALDVLVAAAKPANLPHRIEIVEG
jgi:phage tail-like protein